MQTTLATSPGPEEEAKPDAGSHGFYVLRSSYDLIAGKGFVGLVGLSAAALHRADLLPKPWSTHNCFCLSFPAREALVESDELRTEPEGNPWQGSSQVGQGEPLQIPIKTTIR